MFTGLINWDIPFTATRTHNGLLINYLGNVHEYKTYTTRKGEYININGVRFYLKATKGIICHFVLVDRNDSKDNAKYYRR